METMTKREARELLEVPTDYGMARKLGISDQAVYQWGGDDDPIPQQRAWQIRLMIAERKDSA